MPFQVTPSLPTENAVECRTTTYGCCYDRTTPAGGPNGEGCPNPPNYSKFSKLNEEKSFFLFLYYFQLRYNFVLLVTEMLQFRGHSNSRFYPVDLHHPSHGDDWYHGHDGVVAIGSHNMRRNNQTEKQKMVCSRGHLLSTKHGSCFSCLLLRPHSAIVRKLTINKYVTAVNCNILVVILNTNI